MSLELDAALREGFDRTVSRNGLLLIAAFAVFGFLNLVVGQSLADALQPTVQSQLQELPAPVAEQTTTSLDVARPLAVGISLPVAVALSVLAAVVAEALRIVAIRVFASDVRDRLPVAAATRRLGVVTLFGVIAGILASIAIGVSAIFFLIPGLFVGLSLYFVRQEIALEDASIVDALQDSWMLASGNRWELLGLAVILFVINVVLTSPQFLLQQIDQTTATLSGPLLGAIPLVYSVAVVTRAHQQLRAARADRLGLDETDEPMGGR